ncbi:LysM peptidoglycan-binding domain-containing protein [Paenibacillus campi]|uniref:LysM peptidoglycan-binding domain-containing protein n=1 Tax=Paenibacillus campi TaxID=3106031 RepID=UPI002AFF7F54|nr:LysM peptidoglycan-binding domain-containing protein [Paenibacillus sp. SGZ-1014]
MNTKFNKILLSATLAASLGAVAIAPIGGGHAYAATEEKSDHQKKKDKAEHIANNAAFLAAQEAQFQAMFGTPEQQDSATTTQEPANSQAPAANATNKTITVVVPQGASLTQLAAQYGVTVDELVAANNLLPAGFELKIPQK